MHRSTLLAALLSVALPAVSADPAPAQFLDSSVISFPGVVGDYTLGDVLYDPAAWQWGATSKWAVNGAPAALLLSVFVYPLGRMDEQAAVTRQLDDIEQQLQAAVAQGTYSDVVAGERAPFEVVRPASALARDDGEEERDIDVVPKPALAIEPADGTDPFLAALAEVGASTTSRGQRQSYTFKLRGTPVRSLGYVFYRHLFAFKVRVTAPEDSMDQATFEALADTAARNLVPRIQVVNYGQCGEITIAPTEGKTGDGAVALIRGVARVQAENCASSPAAAPHKPARGVRQVEIVYPEGTWRAGD